MSQNLRSQVLNAFKSLHKVRRTVFRGDDFALTQARFAINDEYKKCKDLKDKTVIEELITHSKSIEKELKETVIQAEEIEPGKYQVKLREDIIRLDNVPFKDCSSDKNNKHVDENK